MEMEMTYNTTNNLPNNNLTTEQYIKLITLKLSEINADINNMFQSENGMLKEGITPDYVGNYFYTNNVLDKDKFSMFLEWIATHKRKILQMSDAAGFFYYVVAPLNEMTGNLLVDMNKIYEPENLVY
jgi:hypothetical protein